METMPHRQVSLITIVFAIAVLSLNFALIRGIVTAKHLDERTVRAAPFLAPLWNALLIAGYRLAWTKNRSVSAQRFFWVLLAATLVMSLSLLTRRPVE